ncbi:MAG: tetratricopeptide repeat protein [Gammaproteobacteria bacterium]
MNNRGNALRSVQKFEAALASYTQAVTLRPAYFSALKGMGSVLQTLGRASDALSAFERALALRPTDAETLVSAGHALVELRRCEPAIEYARALAVQPDYPCLYGDWFAHADENLRLGRSGHWRFERSGSDRQRPARVISPLRLGTPLSPAQQPTARSCWLS